MICRAGARFRVLVSLSSGLCYPVHSLVQGLCTKCAIEGLCVPHCPRAEGTVSERHDGPVVCPPSPPELLFQLMGQMANEGMTYACQRATHATEDVKPGKGVGSEGAPVGRV